MAPRPPAPTIDRQHSWVMLSIGIAVGAATVIGAVGVWGMLVPSAPGDGCPFFYPGCPSSTTPLGTAFGMGTAVAACSPAGWPGVCTYSFPIQAYPNSGAGTLTPSMLRFMLTDPNGSTVPSSYTSITMLNASGCRMGTWNASISDWVASSSDPWCGPNGLSGAVVSGDSLVLVPSPEDRLSLSHLGLGLTAMGTGPYSGAVRAAIP